MAQSEWELLLNSSDESLLDRGPTSGIITPPNGGGTNVYGFNSLTGLQDVAAGRYSNGIGFDPMVLGGRITGAIQRGVSAGAEGFSPMLFMSLQGPAVEDSGYLLGLSDEDPPHIILRKGNLDGGLPETVGSNGVLAVGAHSKSIGTWYHLRMDIVTTDIGDVYINLFENDLTVNAVSAPIWKPIPGMDTLNPGSGRAFLDDKLGVASGSIPFTGGRTGFGFAATEVARRGFFDYITLTRIV